MAHVRLVIIGPESSYGSRAACFVWAVALSVSARARDTPPPPPAAFSIPKTSATNLTPFSFRRRTPASTGRILGSAILPASLLPARCVEEPLFQGKSRGRQGGDGGGGASGLAGALGGGLPGEGRSLHHQDRWSPRMPLVLPSLCILDFVFFFFWLALLLSESAPGSCNLSY